MPRKETVEVYLVDDESETPQRCVINATQLAKERDKWISVSEWETKKKRAARKAAAKKETPETT